MNQTKTMSSNEKNLWLDLGLFLLVLLVSAPQATGLAIHEWLSLAFVVPLIFHLLWHWDWIVRTTKRLFSKIPGETRFNLILNLLLFVDIVLVSLSGILISEAALPAIGVTVVIDPFWSSLHEMTANLFLILTGVHIAMHWKWVVNGLRRYVWRQPPADRPTLTSRGY